MAEVLKTYKKSYKVNIPVFEGPLDLLLYLIHKQEIDIYDIPIAQITAQYLEYLEVMEFLDLEVAGEFLLMAATLMEIKSQMLLPPEPALQEEEEPDPRAELVERLLEYQRFREAAMKLEQLEGIRRDCVAREPTTLDPEGPWILDPSEEWWELSIYDLAKAIRSLLESRPQEEVQQILQELITVEGRIQYLLELLTSQAVLYLSKILENSRDRLESIVTILALLELAKTSHVSLDQKELFGEVEIVPARIEQPRLGEVKVVS